MIIKEFWMLRCLAECVAKLLEIRPINWKRRRTKFAQSNPRMNSKVIYFVLSVFLSRTFATWKAYISAEQLILKRGNPLIFVSSRHFFAVSAIGETLYKSNIFFNFYLLPTGRGLRELFHTLQNNLVIRALILLKYFETKLRLHNQTAVLMISGKELASVVFPVKILATTTKITKANHHNQHSTPSKSIWNCDKIHQ